MIKKILRDFFRQELNVSAMNASSPRRRGSIFAHERDSRFRGNDRYLFLFIIMSFVSGFSAFAAEPVYHKCLKPASDPICASKTYNACLKYKNPALCQMVGVMVDSLFQANVARSL